MATFLLIVIFIDFIGLGIPDSLFGAAWPAINSDFGLPISAANAVTVTMTVCSIISSLMSAKLTEKISTSKIAAVSTALTAVGLFGFSISKNIYMMFFFTLFLGFGAGAIDAVLNNYVAVHYRASHMNFLHCFYGIGVTLSPYLMSLALKNRSWQSGYHLAFIIQLVISIIAFASLPLWQKNGRLSESSDEKSEKSEKNSFAELIKLPGIKSTWLVFFGSCALEYVSGTWSSSFLVNSRGITVDRAALFVPVSYGGIAFGRVLSGIFSSKLKPQQIILIGTILIIPAIVLVSQPFIPNLIAVGMFLIGLGNGPLYPNMVHLTPIRFGAQRSQAVMGSQMAAAYIGILSMPTLTGFLAQKFSTDIFPYCLAVLYGIMLISLIATNMAKTTNE